MSNCFEDLCPVKIEDEYKRNEQLKPEDVAKLQNWFLDKPNFPKIPDVIIALFLISANYNIENAKKYIETSLKLRSNTPDFFNDRDPDNKSLQTIWNLIYFFFTPDVTPDNYRVFYTGFLDTDPSNYNFGDACKAFLLAGEAFILTHGSSPGIVIVMDGKGGTYKHLLKVKVNLIMKFLSYVQDALPTRIREIHIINVIPVIDKAMFLAKPFIKKELMNKIHFHSSSNLTEFYKRVPQEILPMDLGGNVSTRLQLHQDMIEKIKKLKDWIQLDEKVLRLKEKMDTPDDETFITEKSLVETEGSFTTLCID